MGSEREPIQRDVLPIPDRPYGGAVPLDARTRRRSSRRSSRCGRLPAHRMCSSSCSTTSALRRRARSAGRVRRRRPSVLPGSGLKYNRFHTTALCAPTRAALLTGRNHHTVGMGVITELATSAPGYSSLRPNTCAPLAQTLVLNGYSTAQFGKCHEVPVWQTSPLGPFDAWPTVAAASSTSTASSAARRISTTRRSTREPLRSSRIGRQRRATTSPRT